MGSVEFYLASQFVLEISLHALSLVSLRTLLFEPRYVNPCQRAISCLQSFCKKSPLPPILSRFCRRPPIVPGLVLHLSACFTCFCFGLVPVLPDSHARVQVQRIKGRDDRIYLP